MDFWDLTKLIFKQWPISLPLLLITAAAGAWTVFAVSPDYKATSYVQLVPPAAKSGDAPEDKTINPWLDLGLQSLNTAATFITKDDAFLKHLDETGLSDQVSITEGYPSPVATIEVIASSKEQAIATSEEVVRRYNQAVAQLQADRGVRADNMIITVRLDAGNNLAETGGKVKRTLIAVVAAGLLMTAGITIGFDALMRKRRRSGDDPGPDGLRALASPAGPLPGGVAWPKLSLSGAPGANAASTSASPAIATFPAVSGTAAPVASSPRPRTVEGEVTMRPAPATVDVSYVPAARQSGLARPQPYDEPTGPLPSPAEGSDPVAAASGAGDATIILPLSFGPRRQDENGGGRR